jgi:HEAT repeat protein
MAETLLHCYRGFEFERVPTSIADGLMRQSLRYLGALLTVVVGLAAARDVQAQSPDGAPRERLTDRFRQNRDTGNVGEAARKLQSDVVTERLDGIRELSASEEPKAAEYLLAAASDGDIRVRIKAIDALGNRRFADATPLFIQQLFLRETEPAVQQRVLAALGKIGDPRSTKPICDFLSRDIDAPTRGTAIFALGEIGDSTALGVLTRLASKSDDPTTSRLAGEAARKITQRPPKPVELPFLVEERAP